MRHSTRRLSEHSEHGRAEKPSANSVESVVAVFFASGQTATALTQASSDSICSSLSLPVGGILSSALWRIATKSLYRCSTSSSTSTSTSPTFVRLYGAWVYALLFAIIFVETGVVVMPFLPGDSLLFVVGAMCGAGLMSLPLVARAALARGGARQPEQLRDRPPLRAARVPAGRTRAASTSKAFDQAHAFYETLRRHHDRRRALHAVPAHLRAVRRRRRADDAHASSRSTTSAAARSGSAASRSPAMLFGNIPWVKEQPRQDHLGAILLPGAAGSHRRLAGAGEAAGEGRLIRRARGRTRGSAARASPSASRSPRARARGGLRRPVAGRRCDRLRGT